MNAVLIHLGCTGPYITGTQPPEYMERCIEQYLMFNAGPLYVLTDRVNIPLLKRRPGVVSVAAEDYRSDKAARFEAVFNYGPKEFWTVSTTRLMYLEKFIGANDLRHVCHFENDVLVYFDLDEYEHVFKRLYGSMAVTPCDPDHHTTGFVYFNDYEPLARMTDWFVRTLEELGPNGVIEEYKVHMVNDMTLIKRYADTEGAPFVDTLPVLPFGEFSRGWEEFGGIFDAAGWGQYVGGTRAGDVGVTYAGHIVGGVLQAHPEYEVVWKTEDGLRFPYFSYDGELVKLNSLHVHSKNMCSYMSKPCE